MNTDAKHITIFTIQIGQGMAAGGHPLLTMDLEEGTEFSALSVKTDAQKPASWLFSIHNSRLCYYSF